MQLFILLVFIARAQGFRLHSYFSPGMMMQRDVAIIVWGYDQRDSLYAELECLIDGGVITHKLFTTQKTREVWEAELPPQAAATICDFKARSGTEDLVLPDIMFGDIWFCSGQSNMEMQMEYIMNSTDEIEASASFTSIRYVVIKMLIFL